MLILHVPTETGVIHVPLNLEDKKSIVAEVSAIAAEAHSVVAAEYHGLTVDEMTELRATARNNGVYLRVVKKHFGSPCS